VGLTGSFKETSFADLLQFYAVSKQTVAVRVRLGSSATPDGVFFFSDGELVGAALGGVDGRDAVRRALRLRDGAFTVEVGARLSDARPGETLRHVVMEEVVRLDEEDRAARAVASGGGRPAGAARPAAGGSKAPDGDSRTPPSVPLPRPQATPAPARPQVAPAPPPAQRQPPAPVAPPAPVTPVGVALPSRPAPRQAAPARPPKRRIPVAAAIALGALVVAAALGGAALWLDRTAPAAAAVQASPAATAVRGVLDDELVLGMVASFTGSNKERGRAMRLGWEAAMRRSRRRTPPAASTAASSGWSRRTTATTRPAPVQR
jgi:hypothetical protein